MISPADRQTLATLTKSIQNLTTEIKNLLKQIRK